MTLRKINCLLFLAFLLLPALNVFAGGNIGGRFGAGVKFLRFNGDGVFKIKDTFGGKIFFNAPLKKKLGFIDLLGLENSATFYNIDPKDFGGYSRNFAIGQKIFIEKHFLKRDIDDYRMAFHIGAGYVYNVTRDFHPEGTWAKSVGAAYGSVVMSNSFGWAASAGLDYYLWASGILRAEVEYMTGTSKVYLVTHDSRVKAGSVELDNIGLTLSLGVRF